MTKTSFTIVPLDSAIADAARRDAAHGAPAHAIMTTEAPNTFPCRHCLRFAEPGERVVLFNHAAIPPGYAYSENGAIFVHLDPCERYSPNSKFRRNCATAARCPLTMRASRSSMRRS